MKRAHLDFETASAAELVGARSVGVHRYAEDESTRIWLFAYSFDDGLVYRWRPGAPDPVALLNHITAGGIVVSHNAMFERQIWEAMRIKYNLRHWPVLHAQQQICTMAKSMAMNLPGALEQLTVVLGATEQKDMEGSALMKRLSKPHKNVWTEPTLAELDRLGAYCDQDVRAELEVDRKVPDLSPHEQKLWVLDQIINDRGIPMDVPSITRLSTLQSTQSAKLIFV